MQAVLILAHTAPEQVLRLSRVLGEAFSVYVHFDRKFPLAPSDRAALEEAGVQVFSEYAVNWSGWSICAATRFLMEKALASPSVTHLHVISGQDWPCDDPRRIAAFYEGNDKIYMECYSAEGVKKSGEPIVYWQRCYFHYDKIPRRTTFGKIYHRLSLALQVLCRVNKQKKYQLPSELMHGSQWMDLPRDAAEYLLRTLREKPLWEKSFQTGFCSDEFWCQTLLWNSPYRERIESDHHRFILWKKKNDSYPAVLDEEDFPLIDPEKHHFCRKVTLRYSEGLIRAMENRKKES